MIKGTVKFFNDVKGFGFIAPDDGGKDVFLTAAAIVASGAARLKAGQRVSFEHEPDVKGPKAVKLTLLDEKPKIEPAPAPRVAITVYHDPSSDESADVLAALGEAGCSPRLVDYVATPPGRDELQQLSFQLREADQSLVRRYDPAFSDLQLDDRFIGDNEFWTAIVEHPSLINGPVLAAANKVRVCKTASAVRAFLGEGIEAQRKPKGISPRIAAMMRGDVVPPLPANETQKAEEPVKRAAVEPKLKPALEPKLKPAPEPKPTPEPTPVPKPNAKPKAAPAKVKKAAKEPAKKPAPKPAKKAKAPAVKKKKK